MGDNNTNQKKNIEEHRSCRGMCAYVEGVHDILFINVRPREGRLKY